jgi:anti-repressor protein
MDEVMDTTSQTPIEIALGIDENGMTTARKLYEFLEMDKSHYSRWYKQNIIDNAFAAENEDYFPFAINGECGGQASKDAKLTADFAKKLSMTAKNEKGEEARSYFVSVENKAKETTLKLQNLSPELQFMINMEVQQKELQKQLDSVETQMQGIRDVVALDTMSWREETGRLMRKIGNTCGDGFAFQDIRNESYKLLEARAGCNIKQRLTNKRRRMAEEGICKSKRDKLNNLDIIGEDKKLIEIYTAIVKELAIKYGVV